MEIDFDGLSSSDDAGVFADGLLWFGGDFAGECVFGPVCVAAEEEAKCSSAGIDVLGEFDFCGLDGADSGEIETQVNGTTILFDLEVEVGVGFAVF